MDGSEKEIVCPDSHTFQRQDINLPFRWIIYPSHSSVETISPSRLSTENRKLKTNFTFFSDYAQFLRKNCVFNYKGLILDNSYHIQIEFSRVEGFFYEFDASENFKK